MGPRWCHLQRQGAAAANHLHRQEHPGLQGPEAWGQGSGQWRLWEQPDQQEEGAALGLPAPGRRSRLGLGKSRPGTGPGPTAG